MSRRAEELRMTNEIRLRKALAGRRGITEKRMFRVGKEQHSQVGVAEDYLSALPPKKRTGR
jgi:hypothetical protein